MIDKYSFQKTSFFKMLVLMMLLLSAKAHPQNYIHEGNISLSNQIQVNNFANTYSDITVIVGNLLIGNYAQETNITDLTPLTKLLEVKGVLTIVNTNITTLQGLHKLLETNYLVIANNDKLYSLMAISQLEKVYGSLQIDANPSLENLEGLENIISVGDSLNGYLQVYNNIGLKTLEGLNALQIVGNNVNISFNDSLNSLGALSSMKGIGASLILRSNPRITTLSGLENIDFLGSTMVIESNHGLTELQNLGSLDSVHSLKIIDNNGLNTLNGLQNLVHIEQNLEILANDALYSLTGLENLKKVNGSLEIKDNPTLENLVGFDALSAVKSTFAVVNNQKFSSFNGLRLDFNAGGVEIINNPLLFACAENFVCEAIRDGRYVYVLNNASGCENKEEIEKSCGVSGIDRGSELNPLLNAYLGQDGILHIDFTEKWNGRLTVVDITVRVLESKKINSNRSLQIPYHQGNYGLIFLRFEKDDMISVQKIMVMYQ